MITTVTFNTAIDQVYEMAHFALGETNRVNTMKQQGGGKGVNVARVIKTLGGEVITGGFVGGMNGRKIEQLLQEEQLQTSFVTIQGESRVCLTVVDRQTKEMTELLEQGPTVIEDEWQRMLHWIEERTTQSSYFVLSGSLPKGLPPTAYKEVIELLKARNIRVLLDTSGEALQEGVKAVPYAIKPNEDEIAQLLGRAVSSTDDFITAGKKLQGTGIAHVCFSLGADGALFINDDGVFQVNAPVITVVNTVGSGDSFLGGLTYKLAQGASYEEAYKWAVACGSANASEQGIAQVNSDRVQQFVQQLQLIKVQ